MAKVKYTREQIRASMRWSANRERDIANEMAAMFGGCDDPLHPFGPQEFRDWQDFVDRVARPLVEAEDDDVATQAAMKLFRTVSPYYLCVVMVMIDNRLKEHEHG